MYTWIVFLILIWISIIYFRFSDRITSCINVRSLILCTSLIIYGIFPPWWIFYSLIKNDFLIIVDFGCARWWLNIFQFSFNIIYENITDIWLYLFDALSIKFENLGPWASFFKVPRLHLDCGWMWVILDRIYFVKSVIFNNNSSDNIMRLTGIFFNHHHHLICCVVMFWWFLYYDFWFLFSFYWFLYFFFYWSWRSC